MCQLLVTASVVPSAPILVILMKEPLSSSETSVITKAKRRNIPEDAILKKSGCSKWDTDTFFVMFLNFSSTRFQIQIVNLHQPDFDCCATVDWCFICTDATPVAFIWDDKRSLCTCCNGRAENI
jgi:hypothetical protein